MTQLAVFWRSNSATRYPRSALLLPVVADKKVTICALCFIQFAVHTMRSHIDYRTAKWCFADYLSCYVSLNQAFVRGSSLNLKISILNWHRFETSRNQITK